MKKLIPICLIFFICNIFFSCEPDPYKDPDNVVLPPITMEGKNTFGCKVNEKIWVAYVKNPSLFNEKLEVIYEAPSLTVTGYFNNEIKRELISVSCNVNKIGVYHIPPPPFDGGVYADLKNSKITCSRYKCIWDKDTKIEITKLDQSKRIISGTFEFKQAISCGDTLDITEGRFDVKY